MRVEEAEPGEPLLGRAVVLYVGQQNVSGIPHDHVVNVPSPVGEDAHLPADLGGDGAKSAGELRRDDSVCGDPSAVDSL